MNLGIKYFIEWLLSVENFEIFVLIKIGSNVGGVCRIKKIL